MLIGILAIIAVLLLCLVLLTPISPRLIVLLAILFGLYWLISAAHAAQSGLPDGVTSAEFQNIRASCAKSDGNDYTLRNLCEETEIKDLRQLKARGPIDDGH